MLAIHPIHPMDQPTRHDARPDGTGALVTAYLDRLGLDAEPPSADALARLHRAHVERVPYETFWIHLREGWGIDPVESMRRIALRGRGGYCFHLNGALAELLDHLGYAVTRHAAGVHEATGPDPATVGNHLALVVRGLPDATNEGGAWYVDCGLGDALHAPLPLDRATRAQGPMRFAMAPVAAGGVGDWHLTGDPGGSIAGVSIEAAPATTDRFTARHRFNATSPESSFARTVTAQRRHAAGSDVLRGCVLTCRDATGSTARTIDDRDEWLDVLADRFGLRLGATAAVAALWTRVRDAHATFVAERDGR